MDSSLEAKVEEAKEKAEKKEDARNLEQRVKTARTEIRRLKKAMDGLSDRVETLRFRYGVLTEVLTEKGSPEIHIDIDGTLNEAGEAVDISDEEVMEALEEGGTEAMLERIGEAEDSIENDIRKIDEGIDERVSAWKEDMESARELGQIIGGSGDELDKVLTAMETFLDSTIEKQSRDIGVLSSEWEELVDEWGKNSGRHSWEDFQSQHGLSDSTVEDLKMFTQKKKVYIEEVSKESLKEFKQIDELGESMTLQIGK